MKLLFDENLAARLAHEFADLYPGSAHVLALRLGGAGDLGSGGGGAVRARNEG